MNFRCRPRNEADNISLVVLLDKDCFRIIFPIEMKY